MDLNHIFDYEDHIRFRQVELGKAEVTLIKERLAQPEGIVWFQPYLRVRESLPTDLLQPTLLSGLRFKHVYFPTHWMPDLSRMCGPERVDGAIITLMQQRSLVDKCRLIRYFYHNRSGIVGKYIAPNRFEPVRIVWRWDGKRYAREYTKTGLEELKKRSRVMRLKRYRFLIKEFQENDHLVYRYFIAPELRRYPIDFPEEMSELDWKIIDEVRQESFPSHAYELQAKIKGQAEMEHLIYEELKWNRPGN